MSYYKGFQTDGLEEGEAKTQPAMWFLLLTCLRVAQGLKGKCLKHKYEAFVTKQ